MAGVSGSQPAIRRSQTFQPKWAPAPLLKSRERTQPQLGWPRTTDSLCPTCVREARAAHPVRRAVRSSRWSTSTSARSRRTSSSATARSSSRRPARTHGTFTDTLADQPGVPASGSRTCFPGRDFDAVTDTLHNHGTSSIKHGRGAVLTIDLTNRCNMMCDPCFMDANQVGYVHELTLDEVKKLLDDAMSVKPRRQMTVQFSGGEPTISPIFLDAVRYAREVGYFSVQAATNGIRFAQEPEFAQAGARGRHAHRLPAVRRRQRSGQRAPQGRQPVRREAARDREPARRRHRRLPGRDDRQHRQQRSGRPDRQVRAAELRQDQLRLVPAGVVHRPRRGHLATTSGTPSATRCRTWPRT